MQVWVYVIPSARFIGLVLCAALSLYDQFSYGRLAFFVILQLCEFIGTLYLGSALNIVRFRCGTAFWTKAPRSVDAGSRTHIAPLELGFELSPVKVAAPSNLDVPSTLARDGPKWRADVLAMRRDAVAGGYVACIDMLNGILLNTVKTSASHTTTRERLRAVCTQLRLAMPQLDAATRAAVDAVLLAYLPSSDGNSETTLCRQLEALENAAVSSAVSGTRLQSPGAAAVAIGPDPLTHPMSMSAWQPRPQRASQRDILKGSLHRTHGWTEGRHPMRGVTLQTALSASLWDANQGTFFGSSRIGTFSYHQSFDTERIDFYVSHAWSDQPGRKIDMLRGFLCIHTLLGRACVMLPILAAFLIPLGFGIHVIWAPFPPYAPSLAIVGLFVLLSIWVALAMTDVLPATATPWALSSTVVWLDRCCLCQDTPDTISAGIDELDTFLGRADGMIAFVSPDYFCRLWTVYELATFCKLKRSELGKSLLLLSLDWPRTYSPLKRRQLSSAEVRQLRDFSCLDATCYKPSDRAMLLQRISNEWGSIEVFDEFVRTELLEVMKDSKVQYHSRLAQVAADSVELLLGG